MNCKVKPTKIIQEKRNNANCVNYYNNSPCNTSGSYVKFNIWK